MFLEVAIIIARWMERVDRAVLRHFPWVSILRAEYDGRLQTRLVEVMCVLHRASSTRVVYKCKCSWHVVEARDFASHRILDPEIV